MNLNMHHASEVKIIEHDKSGWFMRDAQEDTDALFVLLYTGVSGWANETFCEQVAERLGVSPIALSNVLDSLAREALVKHRLRTYENE